MIRILHVLGGLKRGGAETMLMNIYRNIDREKIQFDFIVHTQEKEEYENEILNMGGKVYHFPRYNIKNHKKYVKIWADFFDVHSEYNIVHGHQRGAAFIYLKIAKRYGKITIMHSHSTSSRGEGIEKFIKNILRYPMRRYVDYPFACSIKAGKWLFGKEITESLKFQIIRNGIDVSKYTFSGSRRECVRKKMNLENRIVIGHVGNFTAAKNHSFLLDIFYDFQKEIKNSKLLLVGSGELYNTIKEKIRILGIKDKIIFVGTVQNVCDYLQAMDIFVFPSLFEGLPVSVVEAQANGLRIVLSDAITDEVDLNCNLITWKSLKAKSSSWSETIKKLLKYTRESKSRFIYDSGYDIDSTVQKIEKLYYDIWKGID